MRWEWAKAIGGKMWYVCVVCTILSLFCKENAKKKKKKKSSLKIPCSPTSLVVQWVRICLPMQDTWVRSLIQEDPTCHGATEPLNHDC